MLVYILVFAAGVFVGIYLGNKEFREKVNNGVKGMASKMQKADKTEDVTLKDKKYVIKTKSTTKPAQKELPIDLSTLSKDELIEVLKTSDVKVVTKE